jgi:hypothetical protein
MCQKLCILLACIYMGQALADRQDFLLHTERLCLSSFHKDTSPVGRESNRYAEQLNVYKRLFLGDSTKNLNQSTKQWADNLREDRLIRLRNAAEQAALRPLMDASTSRFRTDNNGIFALATLSLVSTGKSWEIYQGRFARVLSDTFEEMIVNDRPNDTAQRAVKMFYLFEAARIVGAVSLANSIFEAFSKEFLDAYPYQVFKMASDISRSDFLMKYAKKNIAFDAKKLFDKKLVKGKSRYPMIEQLKLSLVAVSYLRAHAYKTRIVKSLTRSLRDKLADVESEMKWHNKKMPLDFYDVQLEVELMQGKLLSIEYDRHHSTVDLDDSFSLAPVVNFVWGDWQEKNKVPVKIKKIANQYRNHQDFMHRKDLSHLNRALKLTQNHALRRDIANNLFNRRESIPTTGYDAWIFQSLDFLVDNNAATASELANLILDTYIKDRHGLTRTADGSYVGLVGDTPEYFEVIVYYAKAFKIETTTEEGDKIFVKNAALLRALSGVLRHKESASSTTSSGLMDSNTSYEILWNSQIRFGIEEYLSANLRPLVASEQIPYQPMVSVAQVHVLQTLEEMDFYLSSIMRAFDSNPNLHEIERPLPSHVWEVLEGQANLESLIDQIALSIHRSNALFDGASEIASNSEYNAQTRDQALLTYLFAFLNETRLR